MEQLLKDDYFHAKNHTAVATTTKRLLPVPPVHLPPVFVSRVPLPLRELFELRVLISKARDVTSSGGDGKRLLQGMLLMDEPILKWLADLLRREGLDKYKPTEEEIICIKSIALLYHELVPLMRTILKPAFDEKPSVSVFVSHTGADKASYALLDWGTVSRSGYS